LIVQANVYDATTSITVCGITSDPTETSFTRPPLAPSDLNGLRTRSRVMVDKITTVPRHRLRHKIGVVSSDDMFEVETALALFLAIPS
jgi:mRNA interferase MazF